MKSCRYALVSTPRSVVFLCCVSAGGSRVVSSAVWRTARCSARSQPQQWWSARESGQRQLCQWPTVSSAAHAGTRSWGVGVWGARPPRRRHKPDAGSESHARAAAVSAEQQQLSTPNGGAIATAAHGERTGLHAAEARGEQAGGSREQLVRPLFPLEEKITQGGLGGGPVRAWVKRSARWLVAASWCACSSCPLLACCHGCGHNALAL